MTASSILGWNTKHAVPAAESWLRSVAILESLDSVGGYPTPDQRLQSTGALDTGSDGLEVPTSRLEPASAVYGMMPYLPMEPLESPQLPR